MGDRDYRRIITNVIEGLSRDIKQQIDIKDNKTIHFYEVVRCLRRSYFDRIAPKEEKTIGFTNIMGDLLRKASYGSTSGEFVLDNIKLKIRADMVVDDVVIIFQMVTKLPENPLPSDALYLNACLWILNKEEGVIVYLTGDGNEASFSMGKDKKMFEESIRRVRVLSNLLEEKKTPIIEPSSECSACQYYEECYIKKRKSASISLENLLGLKDQNK